LQDFESAPGSYAEEGSDDDSEDIGKTARFKDRLNYDSDEKNEGSGEASELIALDNLPKPQKK
jgi:hypothetical protein